MLWRAHVASGVRLACFAGGVVLLWVFGFDAGAALVKAAGTGTFWPTGVGHVAAALFVGGVGFGLLVVGSSSFLRWGARAFQRRRAHRDCLRWLGTQGWVSLQRPSGVAAWLASNWSAATDVERLSDARIAGALTTRCGYHALFVLRQRGRLEIRLRCGWADGLPPEPGDAMVQLATRGLRRRGIQISSDESGLVAWGPVGRRRSAAEVCREVVELLEYLAYLFRAATLPRSGVRRRPPELAQVAPGPGSPPNSHPKTAFWHPSLGKSTSGGPDRSR